MTSKIEKQFFDTFGIPLLCCKKYLTKCMIYDCENCENFDSTFSTYPKITDRILLKLIVILGSIFICVEDVETLKDHILVQCINTQTYDRDIIQQVQKLFKVSG